MLMKARLLILRRPMPGLIARVVVARLPQWASGAVFNRDLSVPLIDRCNRVIPALQIAAKF
jgi:hypothetical protein